MPGCCESCFGWDYEMMGVLSMSVVAKAVYVVLWSVSTLLWRIWNERMSMWRRCMILFSSRFVLGSGIDLDWA